MNATLISPTYPLRGGIAESGTLLAKAMHGRRNVSYKRMYPKFLFPGKSEYRDGFEGHSCFICCLDALNPITWFRVARSIKTDVIIIRYWTPALALCIGTLAWLLRKKKIIFVVDNIVPHEKFPFSKLLTKYAFRHGNGFLFFSEYVRRDYISKLFSEKLLRRLTSVPDTKVVPMPIINPGEKIISKKEAKSILGIKDERVILFFGLVRKYKGLDTLIKAMPDILKEVDVRLLIVGEFYENVYKYIELIKELRLFNKINLISEYVEKVAPFFCAVDVVVLPYKHATQSAVVRLAQYFKKPCIVTDVGGLSEMVTPNQGCVVKENQIAETVIDFFTAPQEDDNFSDIPTWDNVVEAIEELI